MKHSFRSVVKAISVSTLLLPAIVCAETPDSWKFGGSIYGWFPDMSGTTSNSGNTKSELRERQASASI